MEDELLDKKKLRIYPVADRVQLPIASIIIVSILCNLILVALTFLLLVYITDVLYLGIILACFTIFSMIFFAIYIKNSSINNKGKKYTIAYREDDSFILYDYKGRKNAFVQTK